jgi:lipoprotein signal peptidase
VIPRQVLLVASYGLGVGLALYGPLGLIADGLRLLGVLAVPPSAWTSLRWHVFVWAPWWIVGGVLFLVAARCYQRGGRGA